MRVSNLYFAVAISCLSISCSTTSRQQTRTTAALQDEKIEKVAQTVVCMDDSREHKYVINLPVEIEKTSADQTLVDIKENSDRTQYAISEKTNQQVNINTRVPFPGNTHIVIDLASKKYRQEDQHVHFKGELSWDKEVPSKNLDCIISRGAFQE